VGLGESATILSSFLLETELRRAAVRTGTAQEEVTTVISYFDLIELDMAIFRQAGLLPGKNLRSLDALHLAVAIQAEADLVLTYDERQAAACGAVGLRAESPS
jgi:predicted nucleic acid-binding protein